MKAYKTIIENILRNGKQSKNRTGTDTIKIAGCMFEHDMAEGFPLLTTKYVPLGLVASELEFFIKGLTDKRWLQDRGNHIWDEWCNPEKVPYGHDEETQAAMRACNDLGPIYGKQWRNFGRGWAEAAGPEGVDQLMNVVNTLKTNPDDRRMIVSAWNPLEIHRMALPPCHYGFQVTVNDGYLNLLWNQRSVDSALGLPFNIASYGLLLELLAKEAGFKPGKLIGFLGDTHIYVPHIKGLLEQMSREPYDLPTVKFTQFDSIFNWEYHDTEIENYQYHEKINFDISI